MADDRTYIRLHDGMPGHPKVRGLSDKAFRCYISALCYCSAYLTDGVVVAAVARDHGTVTAWRELTSAGLVESAPNGYLLHDYLEHQRSAADVVAYKEKKRSAGRKGGQRSAQVRAKVEPESKQVLEQVLEQTPKQTASKTNPETETETKKTSSSSAKRAAHAPQSLEITEAMRTWAEGKAAGVDLDAETDRFLDFHRAKGSKFIDWTAAWRTWMSRAYEYGNVRAMPNRGTGDHAGKVRMKLLPSGRWAEVHPEDPLFGVHTEWRVPS